MSPDSRRETRIGFMPLLDCALLVVAHEVGMARQEGLSLRLIRESSWANIRDRVAIGHFDAAHMLGPMVVAENVGAGHLDTPLIAPVALGTGANAITVSTDLWLAMQEHGAGVGLGPATQAHALAKVVAARTEQALPPLTLAMVFPFSCHNYQLRDWLTSAGIDPDRDVRLVVLPPPLLVDALRSGQVDGFCVGEPWNSLAVDAGIGVIAAVCSDVWDRPPEKVLGMRASLAEESPHIVAALVRSIDAASRWAAAAGNRRDLAHLLSQPRYVGVPARLLQAALDGEIRVAAGREPIQRPDFASFGPDSIVPYERYAELFYGHMRRSGQVAIDGAGPARARSGFRPDIFAEATRAATGKERNS